MKPAQLRFQRNSSKHLKRTNGQFCTLNTPLLLLANSPTCLSSLYTKDRKINQKRCSLQVKKANSVSTPTSIAPNVWIITSPSAAAPALEKHPDFSCTDTHPYTQIKPACSTTSQYFHLPPRYESHDVRINISLTTANLNAVNISAQEFRIWQHLEAHWNKTSLQHLANIPSVPPDELY